MKYLIILLFLPIGLSAQIVNNSRIQVGLYISPSMNGLIMHIPNYKTRVRPGLAGEATLNYRLNDQFTIQTGFGFGKKTYGNTLPEITLGSDIDPQTGSLGYSTINSNYQILELQIPLRLRYNFAKDRFFAATGFGLSRQVIHGINHTLIKPDLSEQRTYSIITSSPLLNIYATISMGYMQPIGQKIDFTIEPLFNYHFKHFDHFQGNMFDMGLRLGLSLDL